VSDWVRLSPTIELNFPQSWISAWTHFWTGLRTAEKLVLFYFFYVALEAAVFPMTLVSQITVAALNLTVTGVIALLGRFSAPRDLVQRAESRHPPASRAFLDAVRDWLPALLILVAYRESGLFYLPNLHHLDRMFQSWDQFLLQGGWVLSMLRTASPWLQRYLEFCYLLCYPFVPLGFATICILRARPRPGAVKFDAERAAQRYWTAVLLALFTCFALYPFFPSMPPRLFAHELPLGAPAFEAALRKVNYWILHQYAVSSSVFPSGHVAAVTATALSVRTASRSAGWVFIFLAGSITAATVIERYHYSADAIAGCLIGVCAYLIAKRIYS
jgi:membrane-associated phospholipid phosphatase